MMTTVAAPQRLLQTKTHQKKKRKTAITLVSSRRVRETWDKTQAIVSSRPTFHTLTFDLCIIVIIIIIIDQMSLVGMFQMLICVRCPTSGRSALTCRDTGAPAGGVVLPPGLW